MIKFDLNSTLLADSPITPQKENAYLTQCTENTSSKTLPLISIKNVDTTLPKQDSIPSGPNSLIKKLHHIENNTDIGHPFSVPTPDNRLNDAFHQNPKTLINTHPMFLALETALSHKEIKKTQYADIFKELLSLFRHVEKAFMSYSLQAQLTPSQQEKINPRESTVEGLMTCFCMLPNMLLNAQKMAIHTQPLLSPPYKVLSENIKYFKQVITNTRDLISQSHTQHRIPYPVSRDITCTMHTILQKIAYLINILKKRSTNGAEEPLSASMAKTLIPSSVFNKQDNEQYSSRVLSRPKRGIDPAIINHDNKPRENADVIHQPKLNPFLSQRGESEIQLNETMEFDCATQIQLDKNIEFIKSYYHKKASSKPHADATSLDWWWNETEWHSSGWREESTSDPAKMVIRKNAANKINVININNKWYLNDWAQQKAYLYATLDGLAMLSESCRNILEDILYRIFKTNPDTSPENTVKIVQATLSALMFQNSQNIPYVMDILQIKYLLMLATSNKTASFFVDIEQIYLLLKLHISLDNWQTLQKIRLLLLCPTNIDTTKYETACKAYYQQSSSTRALNNLDNPNRYYKGIAACAQFLGLEPINEQNHGLIFNKALFHFTKKQSIILSKAIITQEDKDELIQLNVAKYHLYVVLNVANTAMNPGLYALKKENTAESDAISPKIHLVKRQDPGVTYTWYHENHATSKETKTAALDAISSEIHLIKRQDSAVTYALHHDSHATLKEEKPAVFDVMSPEIHLIKKQDPDVTYTWNYDSHATLKKEKIAESDAISPEIHLIKRQDPGVTYALYQKSHATRRLIDASTHWKSYSAMPWMEEKSGIEGKIYAVSGRKYIYLRDMLWEIYQTAEDRIAILAENDDGKNIALEAICVDDVWDIAHAQFGATGSAAQLDIQLALIKFYFYLHERYKPTPGITSLHWWLYYAWKDTQFDLSTTLDSVPDNKILTVNNKKYLYIYPYYWEYESEDNDAKQGTLKNRVDSTIKVIFNDSYEQWFLNDWSQQRIYLYAKLDGLAMLSESCRNILEDILSRIFKTNPETPPEHAMSIADTALSILLCQNTHNKAYVNDILQLKYFLMLIMPDRGKQLVSAEQMEILYKLGVPLDWETLKANLYQLYPTNIDNKKYIKALIDAYNNAPNSNSPYDKGIAYCNDLISKFKNENNDLAFNAILFYLTKKELTTITREEENEELTWLNIAKYHLYTTSKYLALYASMVKDADKIRFSADKSVFSVLKQSKIEAVKMYYRDQENLNDSDINFSDKDMLQEYDAIIALKNDASEYLDMAAAALFYQAYHSEEKFSGFDFIKAKLYYKQRIEQFLKEIYAFDAPPPANVTYHDSFKPSSHFSSRSDYTQQFNDYIDNGSSNYESKLLTPLLLNQYDISIEDLSLPPKRWFTVQLHCYDYPENHLGWPIHDTVIWPENLHIIQLHSGNYLTISEINGNIKINVMSEAVYNFSLQESTKKDTYFYAKSDNAFLNALIGPIPPAKTALRNCELKIHEEKKVPRLVKTAVQQAINASLNALAGYQKNELETVTFTEKILEILVPFYREFYYHLTDSKYIINKTSLLVDAVFITPALKAIGVQLKLLGETASTEMMTIIKEGMEKGLNKATLAEFVIGKIAKTYASKESLLVKNELEDLIASTSINIAPLYIIRAKKTITEIPETQAIFPLNAEIKHPIPLNKSGEFGRYKGIYNIPATKMDDEAQYFIKNKDKIYQVRWDKNKYTWRLIENQRIMGELYGMPIEYLGPNSWKYNTTLRLRGGGIENPEIVTTTEETLTDFNARNQMAERSNARSHNNLFNSNNILKDPAATLEINNATKKAKDIALDMVNNAVKVFDDKNFISRIKKLIKIFTNRNDEQSFLILLNKLKKALKHLNVINDIKLVNVENSNLFAQISPYNYSAKQDKYLSINYSGYQKNKTLIFKETVDQTKKKYYADENFARTLIHEFTHAYDIFGSTDSAGYIELLTLNGKHDVTKLLLKAKLRLPEVRNNADSLAEIIFILAKTQHSEVFLDVFLEEYQNWSIEIEKRIKELDAKIKSVVANRTQLSWQSNIKSDIIKLKKEYNVAMCDQLISEVNTSNAFIYDINAD